jgi:hypothetical protein
MACVFCAPDNIEKINNLVEGAQSTFETTMVPCNNCSQLFKVANIEVKVEAPYTNLVYGGSGLFSISDYRNLLRTAYVPKQRKVKKIDHERDVIYFEE